MNPYWLEAEAPPLLRLDEEAVDVVEPVEHAIEYRNARGAGREHDHLQRCRDWLPRRVERQAQVGTQIVGAGDKRRRLRRDIRRR